MPQRSDKWKELFADLGRPTLRGIRKCPKCGTVNGTRGNSCKNKTCDAIFRNKAVRKESATDACRITCNMAGFAANLQIFSVRLRDRGPDYRNFVRIPCSSSDRDSESLISMESVPKCFVQHCSRNPQYQCHHIESARLCYSESQPLPIKHSVLSTLNIPPDCQQVLSIFVNDMPELLVQRVSKVSFVVKCNTSTKHPFGYLHIMFFKPCKDDTSQQPEKKFLCTCRPFKLNNRDLDIMTGEPSSFYDSGSKLCMHFYACICAFASNEALTSEFEYFIAPVLQDCTPTLLSQLHLVTLPDSNERDAESLDPNHIAVEIMRENISLFESITAADDSALPNVQGLEGVFSDQIIVTNVEDELSMGDSGLEGLVETEQQVCHIFASAQNTMHLTNTFTTTDVGTLTTDISNTAVALPPIKRRKEDCSTLREPNNKPSAQYDKPILQKRVTPKVTSAKVIASTILNPTTSIIFDKRQIISAFETWLAGVNERINHTMNYRFDGKPDPLIYYVPQDIFECFKERITTGGLKKRRLPNQTVVINRIDKPPAGTFTKHVWKITNTLHILQIFNCSLVPLKINQYFIQSGEAEYAEWSPPKDGDGPKKQPIVPVLHSTYIKVGRNDVNPKEFVPFVIEWIPDIFPISKMGELSLSFQFGHTGVVQTEEHKRSNHRVAKNISLNAQ